jgi:hypothetical protein
VKDPKVKQGVQQGLTTELKVQSPNTVTVKSLSVATGGGRRLNEAGKIKVDYLVTVIGKPEDFTIVHDINSRMGNTPNNQKALAAAIKTGVEATTGKTVDVVVKDITRNLTEGTGAGSGSPSPSTTITPVSSANWRASVSTMLWMIAAVCMVSDL